MNRMIICSRCGQEKEHCAKGMCRPCYYRGRYSNQEYRNQLKEKRASGEISVRMILCPGCGRNVEHYGKGLCKSCWGKGYYEEGRPAREEKQRQKNLEEKTVRMVTCPSCGEYRPHKSKGLCESCYLKQWRKNSSPAQKEQRREYNKKRKQGLVGKKVICSNCGEEKPHCANGLCTECYGKLSRQDPEHKAKHAEQERKRRVEKSESYVRAEKKRSQSKKRKEWERKYNYEYYRNNIEKMRAYAIEYRKADRERQRVYMETHRNREKQVETTLTLDEWNEILERYNHSCYYCGRSDLPLQMDHKIPVSRNGGLTADNIVPACPPCNNSKKTKTPEEFAKWLEALGKSHQFHP